MNQIISFLGTADFANVESVCQQLEIDDQRSYFFSKEVVIVWTMQNRWTWRDRGIRMNCVSPGPVDTPILADFLDSLGEKAKQNRLLMDRYGEPADIAPVIAFLCSDSSAWIRGSNIPCDGGMLPHIQCQNSGLS